MDARTFTVGPLQENCYVVRRERSDRALVIDPGDEAQRLQDALAELETQVEAILLTHTHFDHIGAVAELARASGAPVYCPRLELDVLRDPAPYVPMGFPPVEGWETEHALDGGELLQLGGFDIHVLHTPGHSPGHVTYAIEDHLFSGDVLFAGSVGRTDLPGGDHATLLASIAMLVDRFDDATTVHPGHMGLTTLGRERATNPFLQALARQ